MSLNLFGFLWILGVICILIFTYIDLYLHVECIIYSVLMFRQTQVLDACIVRLLKHRGEIIPNGLSPEDVFFQRVSIPVFCSFLMICIMLTVMELSLSVMSAFIHLWYFSARFSTL